MSPLRIVLAYTSILVVLLGASDRAFAGDSDGGHPPGSRITFVATNLVATANGEFHRWRIVGANVAPADPGASWIEVEVDLASVDTGIDRRDEHLRTEDFFGVEEHPRARVRVHSIRPAGDGAFDARFDVTIRGVTQTLDGAFVATPGDPLQVEGTLELSRTAFGVGAPPSRWNPLSVDDAVVVSFVAELPLDSAPPVD